MITKQVIVNLATDKYVNSRVRLWESLDKYWDGWRMMFTDEGQVGSPLHADCPYGFKVYTIEAARQAGYTQVLWLDSSVYAIKNLSPCFEEIKKHGMIFQDAGHLLGNWTNDQTLEYFGITREEAMSIHMIGNAGFLGFDFTNPIAQRFFEWWKQSMLDGMFNDSGQKPDGDFKRHTWDMSCSSAIVYKMGLTPLMKSGIEWLQYVDTDNDEPFNDKVLMFARGIN